MAKTSTILLAALIACLALNPPSRAQTVTFDFDSGTPPLSAGMSVPFNQTVGGITAGFSSPTGNTFYLGNANTTFWRLTQFSGNYLIPNTNITSRNHLVIAFSQPMTSITLTYATVEFQDNAETPDLVLLTATSSGSVVGTASTRGAYLGDTFPMGSVTFTSPGPSFDKVDVYVPFNANGCTDFLADNVIVQATPAATAGSVPDGSLVVDKGIGGALDLYWSPSCLSSDVDYAVYEGTLGDFTSHVSRVCSTSGSTAATIVPGVGNVYYLVAPHNGAVEGSYGTDGASVERPAAAVACFPQALGVCP
jgi:hypothetical protein